MKIPNAVSRIVARGAIALTAALTASCLSCAVPAYAQDPQASPPAAQCSALTSLASPNLVITTAQAVAAGPSPPPPMMMMPGMKLPDLPAHCLVRGVLNPRKGADGRQYGIGFELRMPQKWNERFLFQGGGGLDGFVLPAVGATAAGEHPALTRGFAVISSDGGHEGMDLSFAGDEKAKSDYAYAQLGAIADLGKTIVAQYYGKKAKYSYFVGCSNGGREAMVAADRFPGAFDGVVAGDPGFNLSAAAINEVWSLKQLEAIAPKDAQGQPILSQALSDDDLGLVAHAVLAACDGLDGLADGMINNRSACRFDPKVLTCKKGQSSGCLAPHKITALKAVFNGPRDSSGHALYASLPYDAGIGTPGWRMWKLGNSPTANPNAIDATMGLNALRFYFLTPPQPGVTAQTFDFDHAVAQTRQTADINDVTGALSAYAARGGKLIVYQGMSDPVFSANAIIDWYRHIDAKDPAAQNWARLFLVPGMNHCGGGPACDQFDALSAVQSWTEESTAPDRIVAHGQAFSGVERPLCPFPKFASYSGGNVGDARSFVCKAVGAR